MEIKIRCAYDKLVPIEELKPHPDNENTHSKEQIERIALLLEYQGFRKPLIVSNPSGFMVTGHGSLMAAKKNKYTEVPVSFQDFEEDQEAAHRIADNASASWAILDLSKVNLNIPNLSPNFNIELLGIKDFEIEPADRPIKICKKCGHNPQECSE